MPADPFARTILVVDDTTEMRVLLGEILRDDYRVLFARDGHEGLEVAQREHPDLIISDVMMPHVDGQEFCRRIKDDPATAHIPFVMLTAKAELAMKIGGLELRRRRLPDQALRRKGAQGPRSLAAASCAGMHQDLDRRNRELRTAYNELRALQNQLVQAEKMSSLGQLIAGLAHEINNSINAVYNGIQPLSTTIKRLEQLLADALAAPSCAASRRSARRNRGRVQEDLLAGPGHRDRRHAHGADHRRSEDVLAPRQRRLPGLRPARVARHVREPAVQHAARPHRGASATTGRSAASTVRPASSTRCS